MPSKKSKSPLRAASPRSRSSPARDFSESELVGLARELIDALREGGGSRVLLEGPLGAGKTTLVSHLLRALGVEKGAEGSPSFPIAHEYRSPDGRRILHVDFYRLRSEAELEQTGLLEALWDPGVIALAEWGSLVPSVTEALRRDFRGLALELSFGEAGTRRRLIVTRF